jgi:hypothetical protein
MSFQTDHDFLIGHSARACALGDDLSARARRDTLVQRANNVRIKARIQHLRERLEALNRRKAS